MVKPIRTGAPRCYVCTDSRTAEARAGWIPFAKLYSVDSVQTRFMRLTFLLAIGVCAISALAAPATGVDIINLLPPGPGNPRNTEGDFIELKDGRILFAYTKFTGGGGDHDSAHIAGRYSDDRGRTWTKDDVTVVSNDGGMNVMSVSFLRLRDGRIALLYLRKNSTADCRPMIRFSSDEAKSWTEPAVTISDSGYFVLNNDRAVQLRSGRIILPVALHTLPDGTSTTRGTVMAYFSDDQGKTWRRSKSRLEAPTPTPNGLQEPGVVELKDGRLMMFCRTDTGRQYVSHSNDGGDTWSEPEASNIMSPLSPASIERVPGKGDLLMVWNDHSKVDESFRATADSAGGDAAKGRRSTGKRTPLTVAISRDEGKTWERVRNIADAPDGWYCYTAIEFVSGRVLLAYNAGGTDGLARLSRTQIATFPVSWLYE